MVDSPLIVTPDEVEQLVATLSQQARKDGLVDSPDNQAREAKEKIDEFHARPVLSLTIAFPPSANFIKSVKKNLTKSVSEPIVLEIKHDRAIVAGAIIGWKGRVYDHSIESKIDNEMENIAIEIEAEK